MLRERGAHVLGEALTGEVTIGRAGETFLVTDGPFTEPKEAIGGIYVVECSTRDEALQPAVAIPQGLGLAVEVLTIAEL